MSLRRLPPDADAPAEGYQPMRVPNAGDVMLHPGTRFIPVAPELLAELSSWSGPVHVRVRPRRDGLLELELRP
jgi:hypothetical protein